MRLYYISQDETLADLMANYIKTTKFKSNYKGLYTYFKLKTTERILDPSMTIADFKLNKHRFWYVGILSSESKLSSKEYNSELDRKDEEKRKAEWTKIHNTRLEEIFEKHTK